MNINNWEIIEIKNSNSDLNNQFDIVILDNKLNLESDKKNIELNSENSNIEKSIISKDKKLILTNFYDKLYDNLYNKYITFSFILLKPFELLYYELNKNDLDQYIF